MRLQLALNVADLDEAVSFYSKLFNTEPAKTKPGYANFAVENPPLKLVLFENGGEPGSINHLGVETETAEEVETAEARLRTAGLQTTGIDETICCYAEKVETWITGPDGHRWEWYVKQADVDGVLDNVVVSHRETASDNQSIAAATDTGSCCAPAEASAEVSATACC